MFKLLRQKTLHWIQLIRKIYQKIKVEMDKPLELFAYENAQLKLKEANKNGDERKHEE